MSSADWMSGARFDETPEIVMRSSHHICNNASSIAFTVDITRAFAP